ncbi:MAG TPA: hypothetical protein VF761_05125 [Gemmatimonadaceae bacterium]
MHRHGGSNRPRTRPALTLAIASVFFAAAAPLRAQAPIFGIGDDAALVAPRTLRFGVRADFLYADALRRANGDRVPLASSLGFGANDGVSVSAAVSETRLPIMLEYGVIRRLTLGVSAPMVRRRVEIAADTAFRKASAPPPTTRLADLSALASLNHTNVGDIDFSARIGLIDGFASRAPLRMRLSVEGVFRLGAGPSRNASVFVDPGAGDGQNDVELRVLGDVAVGRVLTVSARAAHTVQRPDRQLVVYADTVFPSRQFRRAVDRDLGDITTVEVTPKVRLTRFIAIALDVTHRTKTADSYDGAAPAAGWGLVAEPAGGYSATHAGFGIVFSTGPGAIGSWPVDLQFQHSRIVHSSGAAIPDFSLDQIGGRVYIKLF